MNSAEVLAIFESPLREPVKMRRTIFLTVIMFTLTTALYSLRVVRQPDQIEIHVAPDAWNSRAVSLPDAELHMRSAKRTENDEPKQPEEENEPKPKQTIRESMGDTMSTATTATYVSSTASNSVTTSKKPEQVVSVSTTTPTTTTEAAAKSTSTATQIPVVTTSSAIAIETTTVTTLKMSITTMHPRRIETTKPLTMTDIWLPSWFTSWWWSTTVAPSTLKTVFPTKEFCEEPAYHEFPADIFTNKQRAGGAVIIHILIGVYMFYALAVVCDEYFVASMERICQSMGLSEDIAGATFMAAGSSAPELFASLLGVFVAKGDVGTGTIVGSAVFNVLFVIGFCAFFCGQTLSLNWWPLFRDSAYYAFTVVVLVIVLADGYVTWLESVFMLILYVIYIVLMKYNIKLRIWLTENTRLRMMDELTHCTQGILKHEDKQIRSSYVQFTNDNDAMSSCWRNDDPSQLDVDEIIRDYPRKKMTLYEAALIVMTSGFFRSITRFRCACKRIIVERRRIQIEGYPHKSITISENHYPNPILISREMTKDSREAWKKAPTVEAQGLLAVIAWFVTIPVLATLYYTIPDCRNSRWERYFILTFLTAIIWIAFFSYILVWMVTLVGYSLGIPDTIMGITFLAAGTSVPDAYASLLVAKQGLGDMAVANSLGSNVFDILIGLALPWFLKTAVTDPNTTVRIRSSGMVYNVFLLFLSIFATIVAVHHCRWQLDKRLGVILLVCYAVFLFFAILIECNVFGFVNYPECEE